MTFPNLAGKLGTTADACCVAELNAAGIKVEKYPECMRSRDEVKTVVVGTLHGWMFRRAWYYWVAEGPGLPLDFAIKLHRKHGKDVRVDGHCGCPTPFYCGGTAVNLYHVDTPDGLVALAQEIEQVVQVNRERYGEEYRQHVQEYEKPQGG